MQNESLKCVLSTSSRSPEVGKTLCPEQVVRQPIMFAIRKRRKGWSSVTNLSFLQVFLLLLPAFNALVLKCRLKARGKLG